MAETHPYAVYPPVTRPLSPTPRTLEPTVMSVQARDQEYNEYTAMAHKVLEARQFKRFNVLALESHDQTSYEKTHLEETSSHQTMESRDYRRRPKQYRISLIQRTPSQIQKQLVEAYMKEFKA
ncbi:hypothetical protein BDF14DRAFT_1350076 [Spinellus fusiger]|nr:hypothetical protein BDF14DRAFT_1350076 [Spinellus fusiger]